MDIEAIREYCLSLPATTEKIQWGADLVFKVGGKMYAAVVLDDRKLGQLSFKSTPEGFADLVVREGELRTLLRAAYEIVRAALPRKVQARIAGDAGASPPRTKPRRKSRH